MNLRLIVLYPMLQSVEVAYPYMLIKFMEFLLTLKIVFYSVFNQVHQGISF